MNCTNKEQETAECEKRGCEGCFYNDEIKVGEYVRTKLGDIKKITEGFEFVIERLNKSDNYITKHSSNIIDLIEANDYVNGSRVFSISDGIVKTFNLDYVEDEIKSIVTHQQFESIEYTIHEREEKENG